MNHLTNETCIKTQELCSETKRMDCMKYPKNVQIFAVWRQECAKITQKREKDKKDKSRKTTALVPICDVCFYVSAPSAGFLQCLVRVFFGCLAAVACGMLYAVYLSTYHDRKFWFSTRQVGDWWLTLFSLHCHIISFLNYISMRFRSWSVKSLSKKAADSIITTTSTCWRPRRLKEVLVPEENLLDTFNNKTDNNLGSRDVISSVCLHTLKYMQK